MLVIAGLLLFVTAGIILDVMAKNDRKAFIIDANQFAMLKRKLRSESIGAVRKILPMLSRGGIHTFSWSRDLA